MDKKSLREELLRTRAQVASPMKNDIIKEKFLRLFFDGHYNKLFTYVSIGSEVDTKSIIRRLFPKVDIFVPQTVNNNMYMLKLHSDENLEADKRGNLSIGKYIFSGAPDVIIVPMLGYNDSLYRIGYGGGYYDKFLPNHSGLRVGLAYSDQKIDFSPEEYDIPLDIIITERGILTKSL